jgi:hypothetical protein
LFLAASAAPAAHRVAEALAGACDLCHHDAPAGTAIVAACDGPCRDPGHHHHHPHHDEQRCPTCQSAVSAVALFARTPLIAQSPARIAAAPAALLLPRNHDVRIAPARAPPAARTA